MDIAFAATTTSAKETATTTGILGLIVGILIMFVVIAVVWFVLTLIANWHIFKKAGEKGWKGLIPFVNTYVQYKLTWRPLFFWIIIGLVVVALIFQIVANMADSEAMLIVGYVGTVVANLANFVIFIIGAYRLSKSFGHGAGWAVGLVLLSAVFSLMLAFGKSEYKGNVYLEKKQNNDR